MLPFFASYAPDFSFSLTQTVHFSLSLRSLSLKDTMGLQNSPGGANYSRVGHKERCDAPGGEGLNGGSTSYFGQPMQILINELNILVASAHSSNCRNKIIMSLFFPAEID